jgi:hypothetical protein
LEKMKAWGDYDRGERPLLEVLRKLVANESGA